MQNLKQNVLKQMRTTVSADKNRYTFGTIDIDLTYITDRVIAMSFPSEGLEATYRNNINDVAFVLTHKHGGKYNVYNLTERQYDPSKFENMVESWCGWPDHHSPPLITLMQLMKSIHNFLLSHPEHVVAIHCLAGKGRTGTVIACYMIYSGLFSEGVHARNYFGYKRSNTNWGVVGPAQVRTVDYMADLLKNGMPEWKPLRLREIIMNKIPKLPLGPGKAPGCTPIITIHEYNLIKLPEEQPLIWTNAPHQRTYGSEQEMISFFPENVIIMGDLEMTVRHVNWGRKSSDIIAVIAFNTALVERANPSLKVRFTKVDIDNANNDSRFPYDFWIDFVFEAVDPSTELTVKLHPNANVDKFFWDTILALPKRASPTGPPDGSICFTKDDLLEEKLAEARSFQTTKGEAPSQNAAANAALMNKGGWLSIQGHRTKSWKRRWFVLHPDKIEYFKKPNATQMGPEGTFKISEIQVILPLEQGDEDETFHPNSFSMVTSDGQSTIFYADNEAQLQDWLDAIGTTVHLWSIRDLSKLENSHGTVTMTIESASGLKKNQTLTKPTVDTYVTIAYSSSVFRTATCKDSLSPSWDKQEFKIDLFPGVPPKVSITLYEEQIFGNNLVGTFNINFDLIVSDEKPFFLSKWYHLFKPPKMDDITEQLMVTFQYNPRIRSEAPPLKSRSATGVQRPKVLGSSNPGVAIPSRPSSQVDLSSSGPSRPISGPLNVGPPLAQSSGRMRSDRSVGQLGSPRQPLPDPAPVQQEIQQVQLETLTSTPPPLTTTPSSSRNPFLARSQPTTPSNGSTPQSPQPARSEVWTPD